MTDPRSELRLIDAATPAGETGLRECPACHGTGIAVIDATHLPCTVCNGSGERR
jgi:DnaJ-class molecular chaperone